MTMDEERFSLNTAWIKKSGQHFEVVVDPDAAVTYKENGKGDVRSLIKSAHIYVDAKKGELASEHLIKEVFGTDEAFAVAETIIKEGAIQLTKEHRDKVREQKRRRVITMIAREAIDPRTKLPHPLARIELAFEEAKIKLDEFKRAEEQVTEIVRKLQPILPIRFERAVLSVHVPAEYAAKVYGAVSGAGNLKKQEWLNDGSWVGELEMPAGLVADFTDELNNKTHGNVEINQTN
jgi:ribosome maturation protein SDO1